MVEPEPEIWAPVPQPCLKRGGSYGTDKHTGQKQEHEADVWGTERAKKCI